MEIIRFCNWRNIIQKNDSKKPRVKERMEIIFSQKISASSACINLQLIWEERLTFPFSIDFFQKHLVRVKLPYLMNVFA